MKNIEQLAQAIEELMDAKIASHDCSTNRDTLFLRGPVFKRLVQAQSKFRQVLEVSLIPPTAPRIKRKKTEGGMKKYYLILINNTDRRDNETHPFRAKNDAEAQKIAKQMFHEKFMHTNRWSNGGCVHCSAFKSGARF